MLLVFYAETSSAETGTLTASPEMICQGCNTLPTSNAANSEIVTLLSPQQNDPCQICYEAERKTLVANTDHWQALQLQTTIAGQDILNFVSNTPSVYQQDKRFSLAIETYLQATAIATQPNLSDTQANSAMAMLDHAMNALAELQNEVDSGFWANATHNETISMAAVFTTTSVKSTSGLLGSVPAINLKPPSIAYLNAINGGGIFIIALCIIFAILSYCIPDDSATINNYFGYSRRLMLKTAQPPFRRLHMGRHQFCHRRFCVESSLY